METIKRFRKGFLLLTVCLGMATGATAQITCSRSSIAGTFDIESTRDYTKAQDSVQVLAYALYDVYQHYPDFSYVHHSDEEGNIVAVSVVGIRDTETALHAAACLMAIEVLGDAIRDMDKSLLPPVTSESREKKMGEKETGKYTPTPRTPKEKRDSDKAPLTVSVLTDL